MGYVDYNHLKFWCKIFVHVYCIPSNSMDKLYSASIWCHGHQKIFQCAFIIILYFTNLTFTCCYVVLLYSKHLSACVAFSFVYLKYQNHNNKNL